MDKLVNLKNISPENLYNILCLLCKDESTLNTFIFENGICESDVTVARRQNDFLLLNQLRARCKTIKQLDSFVRSKQIFPDCFAVKKRREELESLSQCKLCHKQFCSGVFKDKHEKTCADRRTCKGCKSMFSSVSECIAHEKRCKDVIYRCENCSEPFHSSVKLQSHKAVCRKRRRYRCTKCAFECFGRKLLSRHITSQHGGNQQLQIFDADLPNDADLKAEYDVNRRHILAQHRPESDKTVYNFPTSDLENSDEFEQHLQTIFDSEENAFRLNASLGMILRDVTDGSYRYFIPYTNELIFPLNEVISNRADLRRVIDRLKNLDVRDYVNNQKSKSSLKPFYVTNINYYVYPTNYPLGCRDIEIPEHIKKCRSVLAMDQFQGVKFKDNLCIFRCLFHSRHKKLRVKGVIDLFEQWCDAQNISKDAHKFKGVQFNEIPLFEDCFKVGVNIYEKHADTLAVSARYITKTKYKEVLNLNMFETHVSLIKNMKLYAQKFVCSKCSRHFSKTYNLNRHLRVCSSNVRFRYPGGYVKKPTTVFEEIRFYGIEVDDLLYEKFATFDFEAVLEQCSDTTKRRVINSTHRAVSVSICSNVDGFREAVNFISCDLECLLKDMINYLTAIQQAVAAEMKLKFVHVFKKIEEIIDKYDVVATETCARQGDESTGFDNDSETSCDDSCDSDSSFIDDTVYPEETYSNPYLEKRSPSSKTEARVEPKNSNKHIVSNLKKLRGKIELFCDQLPVLGFNSSRYDLNLIKGKLAKCLNIAQDKQAYVIKKSNKYMCIATGGFKFLDISSYVAPNVSYAQFLKCYDIEEQKQYFPYEFLDSFEKLQYPTLPPKEAFYSRLKGKNTLDADGKTVDENYQQLQDLWVSQNMQCLADLLKFYNNYDVIGLTQGIEKMQEKFLKENVSIFKETISISNYARRKLFRSTEAVFPLFDKGTRDIFKTVQNNIVGGPSIIFTRYMEAGKSFIKNQAQKPVERIIGLDANALYPYALSQEMPTGPYIDRREENNFKPEISTKHVYQYAWMDKIASDHGIEIKHKLNNGGKECRVGPYFVDGMSFVQQDNGDVEITVYEFWGCFYHFHDQCQVLSDNEKTAKRQLYARAHTDQKRKFLLEEGFKLVEIWECDFIANEKRRCSDYLSNYITTNYPSFGTECLSKSIIEIGVRSGKIFGLVECDICLEENKLIGGIRAEEFYKDFPPIFCTTEVSMDSVGSTMNDYLISNNISLKPRRQLVSGTKARKILLATPLLQWYLRNGFTMTHVYRVVEFKSRACFKGLIEKGTAERRLGDADKSKAILADTAKITLNSYYGSVIMDKTKHRRVKYVQGTHALRLLVNDPAFINSTHLGDDLYEVEMLKRNVSLDTCNYIAHFVLNYAKLHMIKFVYEVLHKYLIPNSWKYLEMDTDSLYSGFNGKTLLDCVKPELQGEFRDKIYNSCHLDHVDPSTGHWFPRECCTKHQNYDKRSPGLMKTEQTGSMMICLSSKTYLLTDGNRTKLTCKGVRKDSVKNPLDIFQNVLESRRPQTVENVGFKAFQNTMITYTQQKTGFSWMYTKREVLPNGIDTIPLKITLSPWKDYNSYLIRDDCLLSNRCPCELSYMGLEFFSAHHLYMYMLAMHTNDSQLSIDVLSCDRHVLLARVHVQCDEHEVKQNIMRDVLDIKFAQSDKFRELLVKTGDRNIFISGTDKYWEVGMLYRYAIVSNPEEYPGSNFLGYQLQHEYRTRLL